MPEHAAPRAPVERPTLTENAAKEFSSYEDRFERLQFAIQELDEKNYHPEVLGKGGENIVLMFPQRARHEAPINRESFVVDVPEETLPREMRGSVIKVNFRKSLPLLEEMMYGDEYKRKRAEEELDVEVRRRRREIAELRGYFGFRSVPGMLWKQNAPVSVDVLEGLGIHGASGRRVPTEVPAIYTLQRRFDLPDETEGIEHVEVSAYYPEKRFVGKEANTREARAEYDHAHNILVGKEEPPDREDAIECIKNMYPHLGYAVRLVEDERYAFGKSEKPFTTALRTFIQKCIQYTKETDRVLDVSGRQNIVFIKEGNAWVVKLLDVIQPEAHMSMGELHASSKLIQDRARKIGREYANELESGMALNPLNTLRIMNALAILADVPDRYEMDSLTHIRPETWREGLKEIFLS